MSPKPSTLPGKGPDAKLVAFARYLGQQGISLTPGQVLTGVAAARQMGPHNPRDLAAALRAAFTLRQEEFQRFFSLFMAFFFPEAAQGQPLPIPDQSQALGQGGQQEGRQTPQAMASLVEVLGRRGFDKLDPQEAALIAREIERLLRPLARRLSRRRRPGGSQEMSLAATLRKGLRTGGELVELCFRRPRQRRRRLLVLADVSGSMDLTAPFLFHFLKGLAGVWHRVEVFVFATRLTRVTPWLAREQVAQFMADLPARVPDLAGGTRIGDSLRALLKDYAGLVGPSTVVVMVSDGWDRGNPQLLAHEMASLKARCHRLVWLNPLLASPRYRPVSRGMAAALPFVDHFLPCHNLAALRSLAGTLVQLIR